jgi:flagellar operon protein
MRVGQAGGPGGIGAPSPTPAGAHLAAASGFGDALATASDRLTLSRHAQHRVDRRELTLGHEQMQRIQGAVNSAAQKGARNSVVMVDDLAVVVDIKQRMVVTAMEREGSRDRVFTNIDSVVIA